MENWEGGIIENENFINWNLSDGYFSILSLVNGFNERHVGMFIMNNDNFYPF
jgi:hypothetical protein